MKTYLLLLATAFSFLSAEAQQARPLPGNNNYSYEEPFDCDGSISDTRFRTELIKIRQQATNSGKRILAKKLASRYCLTSEQVYRLCMALSTNPDKISFAKRCYDHCVDPIHYDKVMKAMTTKAMRDELNDYIVRKGYIPADNTEHGACHPSYNGHPRSMSATDFASAKHAIEDANFDNTKLETAKTIATINYLTTDQVVEICDLFTFEQSKLDFAKHAYSRTIDRNNYFKLGTAFTFDASKSELNKFILEHNM